jgi:hypothetical protein
LTIDSGAVLRLKNNTGNPGPADTTYTFDTGGLILNGGQLQMGDGKAGGLTYTVAGAMHITAASSFTTSGPSGGIDTPGHPATDARAFVISANMDGSSLVTVMNGKTSITSPSTFGAPDFSLTGSNSSFSGGFLNQGGWLQVAGIDSLGTGNLTISGFDASNQAIFSSTLDLVSSGTLTISNIDSGLILDHNLTFSAVSIDGTSLLPGSYTTATLTAMGYGANIAGGSDPTKLLTVVPEPSVVLMLMMSGLFVLVCRPRRGLN